MDRISTFTLKGKDIDLLYRNGFLAYTFEHEGKNYGNKVKLASRKVVDVASATFLLLENALSSLENLNDNNSTRSGERA